MATQAENFRQDANQFCIMITYLAGEACNEHKTCEWLLTRFAEIYREPDFQKLPMHLKKNVMAYANGTMKLIERVLVTWHVQLDGKWIEANDIPKGRLEDIKPGNGRYIWNGTEDMFW